jgi:hypothetical protein
MQSMSEGALRKGARALFRSFLGAARTARVNAPAPKLARISAAAAPRMSPVTRLALIKAICGSQSSREVSLMKF